MKLQEAIQKAIEGGFKTPWVQNGVFEKDEIYGDIIQVEAGGFLLDPLFWQSLGKSLGWGDIDHCPVCDEHDHHWNKEIGCAGWLHHWHRFINHLSEGKTIESYFETL